jgi:hypothetical protein
MPATPVSLASACPAGPSTRSNTNALKLVKFFMDDQPHRNAES